MNKLEHKKHYRKPIFIITVIGIILAAGIFSVFSYINTTNAKNVTDRTIEYIRSQCIRYEEITASDLAKSLFRIIDKTQEISRDIANFNDCSIERLKEFVADLSITGVIVLDENGTPENEYYTDDTGYNVWQDYIKQKKLTSVATDTSKTYSDRLFSLPYDADSESDYCYDFAAVTRKDKKGIVFAYLKQSKETINNGQLTLDSLFSGFNLAMNGHIILTDGSKVIATNNNLYKGTILLAEDNRLNMEITEFLLTNEGATVIKAWNGKEAIEIFELSEEYSIDAVLMDIMMPGTDGITAAKAIRSMERADVATVPIIALTANAFTDDKEKSRSAGMNEHLSKPVDSSKLKSVISGYTGKKDLTLRECYLLAGESYDDLLSRLGCDEKIIYNAVKEFMLDLHYIRLLRAIENRDTETAFKAAHTMKGISANLGFTKMYSAFSLVTEELRSGNIEKAAELMTRATDEYQKIIAILKRCMFDK